MSAILESRQIAAGLFTAQAERACARAMGTRYAAATSSGTAALHLALLAIGVGAGDEVLVPSYACPAVAHAVKHAGATPRFVDVDEATLNVTADLAKKRISRRTKALIVTHTFGFPAPLDELRDLRVPIVEDCSTAIGATYHGRAVGSVGAIAMTSFYATKVVGAGQGGMVAMNRKPLLDRVLDINGPDRSDLATVRYNYAMSDLTAGVALGQLRRLSQQVRRRRMIARQYERALTGAGVAMQAAGEGTAPIYYRFVVRTERAERAIKRGRQRGIAIDRPVSWPLHRLAGERGRDFPGTEQAYERVVSLPLYPALTDAEVAQMVDAAPEIFA